LVEPHRRWIKDGPVTRVRRQGRTSSPVSTNKLWIYLYVKEREEVGREMGKGKVLETEGKREGREKGGQGKGRAGRGQRKGGGGGGN
jgi:hypothetical protein